MNEDARAGTACLTLLWEVAQRASGALNGSLEPMGLTMMKLKVLERLAASPQPLPLSQLADSTSCAKSNMTQLIDKLEVDGLVTRKADPEDRRSTHAVLTGEGLRRCEQGVEARTAAVQTLLQPLDGAARAALEDLLRRLLESSPPAPCGPATL